MKPPKSSPAFSEVQALLRQAAALEQQGRLGEAEFVYGQILQRQPRHFDALHSLGIIACETGQIERGIDLIGKALRMQPGVAEAHNNLGNALTTAGQFSKALLSFARAVALKPDFAEAHNNRGVLLSRLGRQEEAIACFNKALALRPDYAEACGNRGIAQEALLRHADAIASHERAIALSPRFAAAHYNLGVSLQSVHRLREAAAAYDRAIALRPDFAEAYANRGNVQQALSRHQEAVANCDAAIALRPDYAEAHQNRGISLQVLGRHQEAIASLEHALALSPTLDFLAGDLVYAKLQICDWQGLDRLAAGIVAAVGRGERAIAPFTSLVLLDAPDIQHQAARIYAQARCPMPQPAGPIPWQTPGDRIRIGYFSADFRDHPVSELLVEVFENHSRTRFEAIGFALGPPAADPLRARIATALDEFHEVQDLSDPEIAAFARSRGIDIAIDLGGLTTGARPGIFTHRAAPVQISYLGYLGTIGTPAMDYLIADRVILPDASRADFTEQVITLPVYQANPRQRPLSTRPRRADLGLPEQGFVFCCFNNPYKITPQQFDLWMRILRRVDGSVLWLSVRDDATAGNLRREAAARGIDSTRLVFAGWAPRANYLARYQLADLFLDTHPYNAGTTASDALWVGLPVLTRLGATFAGRMAASLLHAVGLDGLVAASADAFETRAVALASDATELGEIRARLLAHRATYALFDTERFVRSFEDALLAAHQRRLAGLPAAPIDVAGPVAD